MPSDQDLQEEAQEWKTKGNQAFQKSDLDVAINAYSQGLVMIDRMVVDTANSKEASLLKTTLLSNRAACLLKTPKLDNCVADCSLALETMEKQSGAESDTKLRGKLLYRRAKARYLNANIPFRPKGDDDLNLAAKDLLNLLSFDSSNKDATVLLNTIRAQHASENKNKASNSPMYKTLTSLKEDGDDKVLHNTKVVLGMLTNDSSSSSMELGRLGGVQTLLEVAEKTSLEIKPRSLALQSVACAAIHPPFCRQFLKDVQPKLCEIVTTHSSDPNQDDIVVAALAIMLRLILHLDRDDPAKEELDGVTLLDCDIICKSLVAALRSENLKLIRASLDVLSTWTAGPDRDAIIRASLEPGVVDLPLVKTKDELRQLSPKELSDYRSRERENRVRSRAWAYERSILFCKEEGLDTLLKCAIDVSDFSLRREVTVVLGKLFGAMDETARIQSIVGPYLGTKPEKKDDKKEEHLGPVIEELPDDYEEEKDGVVETVQPAPIVVTLNRKMERAEISAALLLATPEVGAWSVGQGWPDCRADLESLVLSNEKNAMCIAGEVLASAASVKETRPMVATMLTDSAMKTLVGHPDRDIRTAAASAIAKIGLAEKGGDDVEMVQLLEAACHMLEDSTITLEDKTSLAAKKLDGNSKANTSIERGIEVMTYLVSKTPMKEEVAHGFEASADSEMTALQLLVNVAGEPNAGEALTAFGLATIFQHMAVTVQTLRKESFEGKEITMEQYDEIQKMQKTEEEKDLEDTKEDYDDTPENCAERIRKMAKANVPTALVQLLTGASDQTTEQILMALSRMAVEASVRGTMIQQGVLAALIKMEKGEKNPTDQRRQVIRIGRHCLSKLLITTNPSLLTAAQRLGAIKPLIQLVRDIHAKDLQRFEALMAITNIAASGDDAKNKIVAEKGISSLNYAMFEDHYMVKQAATEAMCNLVPHPKMLEHLRETDTIRLWLALSTDFEENYECARAAAGGLAMATQDPEIATAMIQLPKFKERINAILESGRPELMHRAFVVVLNLAEAGGEYREAVIEHGILTFCTAYIQSYNDGAKAEELGFAEHERNIFNITVDLAKQIVKECDK